VRGRAKKSIIPGYFSNYCIIFVAGTKKIFNAMQQTLIKKLQRFFSAYPVEKAWVFGSYARNEQTRASDVDILVRFDENAEISLFDHIRIKHKLQDLLHKKIDLVEDGCIKRFAQPSVEDDKILIYER
jgi:predicted nucleotidyltransferase